MYAFFKGIINFILIALTVLLTVVYYQTEIFDFPTPKAFSGEQFYNPYTQWNPENTQKANFHAHSKAWAGLTNGANSPEEMKEEYEKLGFGLAAISNYHETQATAIPVYEHGFNIYKTHKLAINAQAVSYLDFPFRQNTSQKQMVIDRLVNNGALVALAHPNVRDGHNMEDLSRLDNYQFIEVFSAYANALPQWDQALKNGKPVWCLANDDTHDIQRQKPGRFYNLISSSDRSADNMLHNLRAGNFVSVRNPERQPAPLLESLQVQGDSLHYSFSGPVDKVNIVVDGESYLQSTKAKFAIYLPKKWGYVRLEAYHNESVLLTNPIIRGHGTQPLNTHLARQNRAKTFLYRLGVLFVSTLIISLLFVLNGWIKPKARIKKKWKLVLPK
ncbi:hypothetical protein LAG90_14890 [Marinilongibacter aquaticus]|uniref:hypothetical protein n=1 Tax=Marinilongibacter aquaticus TaxID=2975157 RepID=UPI0021BD9585|nr:hypothetical protein [Marinilongibacter aquaticus]UBM58091.1 hypothetical protein LAG90_14890 [Marinilongibacter aquaticus]